MEKQSDRYVEEQVKKRNAEEKAEIAACKPRKWASFCEMNGQPSGGLFYGETKDKC